MGGLIPESFIEQLLGRVDIVELIGHRVPLKRAGKEFQACCPFHGEKTPSFTVSPQKQFYHCFGCGAHGSAIGFMMNFEGLEFIDAVEELARHAGLSVPREAGSKPKPETSLFDVLAAANAWFRDQLPKHPQAVAYVKKRGLNAEIIEKYEIGFAPAGWDGLLKQLGGTKEKDQLLARAGLLSQGDKGSYDKFRNRVIFPIHDRRGRVIGFGGRAMQDETPKYLNSPETELFHKGRELYALHLARKSQARLDRILVVEGYMDVVALAQFGFENCVATLGTATTPDHAEIAFRAADEVVFCFDGDAAGRKAAWRALESTLPKLREGRQARFLFLPEGEDPDSLVRKQGAAAFGDMLANSSALSEYFFEHFTAMVDMNSIDGRARLIELARPLIQGIPEGVFRDMMQAQLETLARHRLSEPRKAPESNPVRMPRRDTLAPKSISPLRLALTHLVQSPSLARFVTDEQKLAECDFQGMDIYRELVDFCARHPNMTTAQLLESWRDHPAQPHLRVLATQALKGEAANQAREFQDALIALELDWTEALMVRIPDRVIDQSENERKLMHKLQQRKQALKQSRAE